MALVLIAQADARMHKITKPDGHRHKKCKSHSTITTSSTLPTITTSSTLPTITTSSTLPTITTTLPTRAAATPVT
ncbi:11056_t:CDS:1, partial [Racocetra fulgida]